MSDVGIGLTFFRNGACASISRWIFSAESGEEFALTRIQRAKSTLSDLLYFPRYSLSAKKSLDATGFSCKAIIVKTLAPNWDTPREQEIDQLLRNIF